MKAWVLANCTAELVKAQYAVGYFTEMGIGCRRDVLEANVWYVRAADQGDERAKQRLAAIRAAAVGDPIGIPNKNHSKDDDNTGKGNKRGTKEKDCVVM